ncbi:uncharacterized protein LOC117809827 [Xyrichtys novacula]|uniref:Uncharacterized protein LOC117809827 n=1 Tax=Xyrichtys novacula TaxID=13765 RepID=A0AAV1EHN8_XYRNO|nr:uncharacterized protein LOC117809827 [Xyrichtys novacula]
MIIQSSMQTHMSVNSSSTSSLNDPQYHKVCQSIFTALFIAFLLILLPLFIHVLYVGYRRWKRQRCNAGAEMTCHSDVFTYNMVVLELIALTGFFFYCYGFFTQQWTLLRVGVYIFSIVAPGQSLFHVLTCVERYVAVAHPVTYMGLKQSAGSICPSHLDSPRAKGSGTDQGAGRPN